MKKISIALALFASTCSFAQQNISPEKLWELGKVGAVGITKDGKAVVYSVAKMDLTANKNSRSFFQVSLADGKTSELTSIAGLFPTKELSPDGSHKIEVKEAKLENVAGTDFYPALTKSNAQIYNTLNYRHWDTWEDGAYQHIFVAGTAANSTAIDIMAGEKFDCPQMPFGGDEDYVWSPDSKRVLYVTKKKHGTDYAVSTNTDIYAYDLASKTTTNLTEGMLGYDIAPAFSSTGTLAWLSMKNDGFESDKNDIIVDNQGVKTNLTAQWDGTVDAFLWDAKGKKIYFLAPVNGTKQLFEVDNPGLTKKMPLVRQITNGEFDVTGMVGQVGNTMVVSRTDMNHSAELYQVDLATGTLKVLTHVNDEAYKNINLSKVERRYTTASDGAKLLSWVIYPPNFDPTKKYPTLLYCQGGPQGALTQFYSTRWNFQLMAANGYIVVAVNRRGMPGHGVKWNADISKDYGGQCMRDYLSAIDDISKESYVDKNRLGCVGASFGGYSVFYLAGTHQKRFKSFISHDGIFDWRSMYGTTEELFFVNWDLGGNYWDKNNAAAQKAYSTFDPINYVANWDTPILIIQGGKDFRVPIGQGLAAFQAAQLKGLKSRLLYLPEENHWVLNAQNSILWHKEFYKWLDETLK